MTEGLANADTPAGVLAAVRERRSVADRAAEGVGLSVVTASVDP